MGLTLVVCILALFATVTAQRGGECEMSDLFTGGTLEREMAKLLLVKSDSTQPTITVLRNHTVCLSVGPTRGSVSSISLVIQYNCTGSAACPPGGSATEQYDLGCNNQSQWSFAQFSDQERGRTTDPTANFDTSLRTDCGACFPVYTNQTDPPTIDPVTHCHGCRGCSDFGQPACYGTDPGECCSVYVKNMCAGACSNSSDVIDVNFACRSSLTQSSDCSSDDGLIAVTVILIIVVVLLTTALVAVLIAVYRCYGSIRKYGTGSPHTDNNTTHSVQLSAFNATRYRSNDAYGTVQKIKLQECSMDYELVGNLKQRVPSVDNIYSYCEVSTGLTASNDGEDYVIP